MSRAAGVRPGSYARRVLHTARTTSRRRRARSRRGTAPLTRAHANAGQILASIRPGTPRAVPRSLDLAEEFADDRRGQLSTWHVNGRAEPIEVLFYAATWNNPGRGGVDDGSGARWTDATSARDALVRYLTGRIL
jgi:hypothetical protein